MILLLGSRDASPFLLRPYQETESWPYLAMCSEKRSKEAQRQTQLSGSPMTCKILVLVAVEAWLSPTLWLHVTPLRTCSKFFSCLSLPEWVPFRAAKHPD